MVAPWSLASGTTLMWPVLTAEINCLVGVLELAIVLGYRKLGLWFSLI